MAAAQPRAPAPRRLIGIGDAKSRQHVDLDRFHPQRIGGPLVIVTEQMKHAVDHQMEGMVRRLFPCSAASRNTVSRARITSPRMAGLAIRRALPIVGRAEG